MERALGLDGAARHLADAGRSAVACDGARGQLGYGSRPQWDFASEEEARASVDRLIASRPQDEWKALDPSRAGRPPL